MTDRLDGRTTSHGPRAGRAGEWLRAMTPVAAGIMGMVVLATTAARAHGTHGASPQARFYGWCRGDCDGNRSVVVSELVGLVGIALGSAPIATCAAGDLDGGGTITVNELLAGVVSVLDGCPAGADVLLRNGKVFTSDPDNPWVEAVAIFGERIVDVGANDALRGVVDEHTEVIDLAGRTAMAGLNDAHTHVSLLPFGFFDIGLDPTLDAVLAEIQRQVAGRPAGETIGGLIGPAVLDDPRTTRFLLDTVAPANPVYLSAFTGHGLVFNTALMQQVGIAENEPDPPGGFYSRDAVSGVISGIAHEYAGAPFDRRIAAMQTDEANAGVYFLLDRVFAALGITSVQLMSTAEPTLDAARHLAQIDPLLRWRIIRVPVPSDPMFPLDDVSSASFSHPRVTISGLKWILDGTPVERLAAVRIPYADRPGWSGQLNFSADQIEEMLESALAAEEQPMFHAVGDRTIETLLDAMDAVAPDAIWRIVRPRIEHGDLLLPDLVERARHKGVLVVQNPEHFSEPELFRPRFTAEVLARQQPMHSLLQAGIVVALGSDGPATPFDDIRFAVEHAANPPEALTREEAVIAHTIGAASAERGLLEKGRLTPGMLADIAVLSQDIFTVPLEQLSATRSVLTMVGGAIVWRTPDI